MRANNSAHFLQRQKESKLTCGCSYGQCREFDGGSAGPKENVSTTDQPRDILGRYSFKSAGAPVGSLDEPKSIAPEELYDVMNAIARKAKVDPDKIEDVVQDACVDVLAQNQGRDRIPLAPLKQILLRKAARSVGHTSLGSRDRKAMRILKDKIVDFERRNGREPSSAEGEALARQVREQWPDPTHRPSKNFLERARIDINKGLSDDIGTTEPQTMWESAIESFEPGSARAKMETMLSTSAPIGLIRKEAWDAIAEGRGAPLVARSANAEHVRTWCRATIEDYPGGILGAVDTWQRAEEDEGTMALFAPFGPGLDEGGRDAVCAMLRAHPSHAQSLWEAALQVSTVSSDHRSQDR